MCSGSEAGSYHRLVYHSTLGLRVIKKSSNPARSRHKGGGDGGEDGSDERSGRVWRGAQLCLGRVLVATLGLGVIKKGEEERNKKG